jgi:hypothetical protein
VLIQCEASFSFPHLSFCNCSISESQKSVVRSAVHARNIVFLNEMPILRFCYRQTDCTLKLLQGRTHRDSEYAKAAVKFQADRQPSGRLMKIVR